MTETEFNPAPGFEKYRDYGLEIIHSRSLHQLIVNEAVIAASDRAVIVSEQNLYDVLYIPKSDILVPLTRMKGQSSYCPFKGQATYWRFTANGRDCDKAAWSYETPYDEMIPIRGHVAFYLDRLDCYWINGVDQPLRGPGRCADGCACEGELASVAA